MNNSIAKQVILAYTEGWKEQNREKILNCLHPECVVIESYGPTYRGLDMVGCWFDSWFGPGNRVNRWDVTSFYTADDVCFFEWLFACTFEGKPYEFEGASIARFQNDKIIFLREYAMTAPRYEWQG